MKPDSNFLAHATVFGIGALFIPISGVLLLPLYVNYLTAEEFGTLEIVNRIANVLCICFLSVGVYHAGGTFYMQSKDEAERGSIAVTLLFLYFIAIGIGLVVFLPFIGVFGHWFGIDQSPLLLFAIGGNLVLSMLEIPYVLMRCRMESLRFVTVTFLQFLIRIFGTIIAVVWFGQGIWGVLAMYWISGGLFFGILFYREFRLGTVKPNLPLFRPMFFFAIPFLPGGLCTFIQMNADRFFLARYFDLGEVGVYALAAKIAGCVAMLSALPLQRVWLVRQYDVLPTPEGPAEAARWFTLMTAVQLFVGLAVCLFCRDLLTLIGKEEYIRSAELVPLLVLSEYFLYANYFFEGVLFVYRKTLQKFCIGFAATLLMLPMFFLLTPSLGGIGAAASVAAGYLIMCCLSLLFAQKLRQIPYSWKAAAFFFTEAAVLYFLAQQLDVWLNETSLLFRIFVKSSLLLPYLLSFAAWNRQRCDHAIAGRNG